MSYYERFSIDIMRTLKDLNDQIQEEEKQYKHEQEKIIKLNLYTLL